MPVHKGNQWQGRPPTKFCLSLVPLPSRWYCTGFLFGFILVKPSTLVWKCAILAKEIFISVIPPVWIYARCKSYNMIGMRFAVMIVTTGVYYIIVCGLSTWSYFSILQRPMENELVRYSRAGDTFHYRWAARRCLRLINPKSPLKYIVIEGSKERKVAGEYVIDVSEYSRSEENDELEVTYFQLKHSSSPKRKHKPFNLSDLRDTIEGFAKRYSALFVEDNQLTTHSKRVSLRLVRVVK